MTKLGSDGSDRFVCRVAVQSCSLLESSRVVELERFGVYYAELGYPVELLTLKAAEQES